MENIFMRTEKQLKKYLKNRRELKYSLGLVISFLMTGEFIYTNEDKDINIDKSLTTIESGIKTERKKNKKKLNKSKEELLRLELQGDQVVKSPWESHIFSLSGSYSESKKKDKEYLKSYNKYVTSKDNNRINSGNLSIEEKNLSSNWIVDDSDTYYKNYIEYEEFKDKVEGIKNIEVEIPTEINEMDVTDIGIKNPNIATVNVNKPNIVKMNPITVDDLSVQSVITPDINVSVTPFTLSTIGTPEEVNLSVMTPNGKNVVDVVIPPSVIPTVNINIVKPELNKIKAPKDIIILERYIPDLNPDANIKTNVFPLTSTTNDALVNRFDNTVSYYGQKWSDASSWMIQSVALTGGYYWSEIEADGTQSAGWRDTQLASSGKPNAVDARDTDKAHNGVVVIGRMDSVFEGTVTNPVDIHVKNLNKSVNASDIIAFNINNIGVLSSGAPPVPPSDLYSIGEYTNLYLGGNAIGVQFSNASQVMTTNVNFFGNFIVDGTNNKLITVRGVGPYENNTGWHDRSPNKDYIEVSSNIISKGQDNFVLTYYANSGTPTAFNNSHMTNAPDVNLSGKIELYGTGNIGARILTYTPNKSKASEYAAALVGKYPQITIKDLNINGDNSTGVMFGKKPVGDPNYSKTDVGIYQGKTIVTKMVFGEQLSDVVGDTSQIAEGNGASLDPAKVENGIGVYVESGQRLGLPLFTSTGAGFTPWLVDDPIQNLLMDEFDIKFGIYAKKWNNVFS